DAVEEAADDRQADRAAAPSAGCEERHHAGDAEGSERAAPAAGHRRESARDAPFVSAAQRGRRSSTSTWITAGARKPGRARMGRDMAPAWMTSTGVPRRTACA